jgi:unsaturated chondroitin disaccharide hydrolase
VFIQNLPGDFVPYWDFTFNDDNPDIRDTSAASIFCCGLLELCNYVDQQKQEEYRRVVDAVMDSLFRNYSTRNIPESTGFLTEGMYHRDSGANECTIWGDYFYFEAVVRLLKEWNPFW